MFWLGAISSALVLFSLSASATVADDFEAQHQRAVGDNPADVHFTISIRDRQKFRIGERITLDYAFTADTPGKYLAGATNRDQTGRSSLERFVVDRQRDVVDPLNGFFDLYAALYCSTIEFFNQPQQPLGASAPANDSVSLTQYLRFSRPGRYRIYAITRQVIVANASRSFVKRKDLRPSVDDSSLFYGHYDFGGPQITSENIVELEILDQDKAVAREEVQAIIARTKASQPPRLSAPDAVRLFEIGTPQARETAAQLFGSNAESYYTNQTVFEAMAAVLAAPSRAEAVKLLRQRLLDPSKPPDHELFFDLPVLELLEKNPHLSADDIRNGGQLNGDRWRKLLVANILPEYQAIQSSLDQRSREGRALAVRFLDMNLDNTAHKACSVPIPLSEDEAMRLKKMHLATVTDLPANEQNRDLVSLQWTKGIPREEVVPLLQKLYENLPPRLDGARIGILKEVGRDDPDLAGKMFRSRVIGNEWTPELSNFIPESWVDSFAAPELDDYFAKVFSRARTDEMEHLAPLLARFGGPSILPQIQQLYEVENVKWPCSMQAGILTYFLRVDPAYGMEKIPPALKYSYALPQSGCRQESLLADMAMLHNAPELMELAGAIVDDPNPWVAAGGVHVLGLDRKQIPYQRLVERLQKLHQEWGNYNDHTKDHAYRSRWNSGYGRLEQEISVLLTNTTDPALLPMWKEALDNCVTDDCRNRLGGRVRSTAVIQRQEIR